MGVTHVGVCQGSSKDTGGVGGLHMLEYVREAVRILGGGGYTCWSMSGKQ